MVERTVSEADLARLKEAREEADRRYNEALTSLHHSVQTEPDYPHPPPPPDDFQVTPLNERWNLLDTAPGLPGGWRGRIVGLVWRWLHPILERQQAFNSALVDHVNRNLVREREVSKSIASTIATLQGITQQLAAFEYHVDAFGQRLTEYVDTKDYEFHALHRRVYEDAQVEIARLDRIAQGLAGGVAGVTDEMLKRWESMLARDQRYDARISELKATAAAAQQQATALRREVERLLAVGLPAAPAAHAAAAPAAAAGAASSAPAEDSGTLAGSSTLDSWKYVGFEDLYRGDPSEIRRRLESYLPVFAGTSDVLDIGCGRGEFLEILRDHGISARGLDLNHEMVQVCRSKGLDAAEGDALGHLRSLPDGALGGLFAAQVVEHLQPDYLLRLLDEAQRVLRPGGILVLETINAACWLAFFESYIRDITHARPLHPDTLRYLVTASGFADVDVQFREPVAPADRLQPAPRALRHAGGPAQEALGALADTFDGNVERLNRLIFTSLDYAVIGHKR